MRVDKAAGPTRDYLLRLDEGADREEAHVVLQERGGKWALAYATVPAWRQETYGERRGYYIENRIRYVWRDKFRYPVDPSGLRPTESGAVAGAMEAFFRLNQLRDERLPPGTPNVFHTGEVFSWLDRIGYLVHERVRKQQFVLKTEVLPDVYEFTAVMEKAVGGRRRTARGQGRPAPPGTGGLQGGAGRDAVASLVAP